MISRKYKSVSTTLNYIEHVLSLASTITGSISVSGFASLLGIPIGLTTPGTALKICATTAEIN